MLLKLGAPQHQAAVWTEMEDARGSVATAELLRNGVDPKQGLRPSACPQRCGSDLHLSLIL